MIVRVHSAGTSFKGLGQYLTHDPKAETTERVAWTHTLNCANDHVPSAIHEMVNTYRDADLLKEEAGIKRGGAPLEHAVKHFSLNWHPDETPTKEQIIEAVESYLNASTRRRSRPVRTPTGRRPAGARRPSPARPARNGPS